jgi:uncharacterized protein HemX
VGKDGITPATLIAAIVVVIMALGVGGTLMQSQFTSVGKTQEAAEIASKERDAMLFDRIKTLEEAARRQAHEPVEKATLEAIINATDKRMDLFQSQITDINRQIAAALIIIDNNTQNGARKLSPNPP